MPLPRPLIERTAPLVAFLCAVLLAWPVPVHGALVQSLTATVPASVTTNGSNAVSAWSDQSGSANHASTGSGSVTYPAANLFPVGTAGVHFGPTADSLQLLNTSQAASLLDFTSGTGAATANTGFAMLVSVRVDQLNTDWNDLLGVTSVTTGGFGLRYSSTGVIQTYMGTVTVQRPGSDRVVRAGTSIVFAVNYDAATGVLTLWDSLNNSEVTGTIPKTNFAGTNKPLRLGSTDSTGRFIIGSVGAVKLYTNKLSTTDFATERDAMTLTWLGARPVMPTMPGTPSFTISQLLAWNPATDADAPFNVATVPLQTRINVPAALQANANARSGQGGIQSLDTHAGDRPQGGSGSVYTFTYWQYIEQSVYWGGIGATNFVPPTGEMIDNAHRNGVPILGTIFFPPVVYGGNYSWVQTFLTKVGNTYPAADKLIAIAQYYGFDGWFFNQETVGGTATDAAAMRDLIRYIRQNSSLRVTWYDSMTEAGTIAWQDQFNTANDWYMRHNYTTGVQDSTGDLIADSIFTDFSYDTTTAGPQNSRNRADALLLNPYKIWTGLETQAEDFRTSTSGRIKMAKSFPDGLNHLTSVGFYLPRTFATQLPEQDLFWTGASGDPRNTSATVSTGAWKGVAHNIAERSAINTLPFATDFCIGRGDNFYNDGVMVKAGAWWNRALQGILPTWRWIIDSTGTKLTPELWTGDSYRGGSCLRVSGNLTAENTLRLFLTDLPVTSDTRLKIVFKRNGLSNVDSLMQVGVSTSATPTTFTFYPAGNCTINGWNESTINLSGLAGSKIVALALKFSSGTTVNSYEIRIGEIVVYNTSTTAVAPPTNVQVLSVASWSGLVSARVKWDHAMGEHYAYNVYIRLTDGSLVFAGSTPSNYFYFQDIAIAGNYSAVVVQTIGPDTTESRVSDAPLIASNLTWDTTTTDAPIAAGSGNWNTTAGGTINPIWNDGGTNVSWYQNSTTSALNSATFAGSDGTTDQYVVTIASPVAATSMTFNTSGYKLTGDTIYLGNGTTTVSANKTTTINSTLAYATNIAVTTAVNAGATLNLGGGNSGGPQPTYSGAGTLNFSSGTYTNSVTRFNAAAINQTGGTVSLTSTGGNWIGYSSNQSVNYTISGGILNVNNAAAGAYLGLGRALSGSQQAALTVKTGGTVNIGTTAANSGILYLGVGDATANTLLDVQGGSLTVGAGQAANKLIFFNNGANAGKTATLSQSGGTVSANGLQFGNGAVTYNATSSATLQLSGGNLYVGPLGITRSTNASALPITIKLQGGTLGASADWTSPLDMKLGATLGGVTIQAADSGAVARAITLSGNLSNDTAVAGSLTKTGNGTLTLSGNNTYSGNTTISAGTLALSGAFTNNLSASPTINVSSAALLNVTGLTGGRLVVASSQTLKGSGTLTGNVTVAGTARLSPGSDVGQLSIIGGLDLSATGVGTLAYELDSLAGPNDRIAVTGAVAIGNGTLGFNDFTFTNLGGLQAGTYTLITSGGISGTLDPTNLNGTIGSLNAALQLTANDVELVVINSAPTFASWINGFFPGETLPAIIAANSDPDKDGIPNGAEMVIGGNPNGGMDAALLPTVEPVTDPIASPSIPTGRYLLFTYRRSDLSIASGLLADIEMTSNLVGPWTAATGAPGVEIRVDDNFTFTPAAAANTDRVRVYVPLGSNTALFGRLKIVIP